MGTFQRAERKRAYIKIAVTGPSGSGKTYSSLQLAFGLGSKVAVIDTENESASLYADLGEYDVLAITPPFTIDKYIAAIKAAFTEGYDVLVIDSITHAWAGEGGLLAQKEALDARGGNQYTNWAGITKQHEKFKAALLQAPIHLIATMRSKTAYVVEQSNSGKSAPRKVGMEPVQRDGMDYEFTVVFDIDKDHTAATSKDRTGLFDKMVETITPAHGKRIRQWLKSGGDPTPKQDTPAEQDAPNDPTPEPASETEPPLVQSPRADWTLSQLRVALIERRDQLGLKTAGALVTKVIPDVACKTKDDLKALTAEQLRKILDGTDAEVAQKRAA